jgi:hypothetical protein
VLDSLSTGRDPTHDPVRDPIPEPNPDPADAPADAPTHELAHEPAGTAIYAVHDRAGVVVGVSVEDAEADTPDMHAAWLIRFAVDSNGLRGRWVLASVLRTIYRQAVRADVVDPMPWPTVAATMGQVVPRKHKWVRIGGRRRRRLAYLMPERIEDVMPTNVVPLGRRA